MALPSASRIDFADMTNKKELARKSEQQQTGPVERVGARVSRKRARTRRESKEARGGKWSRARSNSKTMGNGLRQQVVCFRLNKSWEIQARRTEVICETLTMRLAKVRRAMYQRITFVRREPILDTWARWWYWELV